MESSIIVRELFVPSSGLQEKHIVVVYVSSTMVSEMFTFKGNNNRETKIISTPYNRVLLLLCSMSTVANSLYSYRLTWINSGCNLNQMN